MTFASLEDPDVYFYRTLWYEAQHMLLKDFKFYRDHRPTQQLHAFRLAGVIFRVREQLHDLEPTRRWWGSHPHAHRMADLEDQ